MPSGYVPFGNRAPKKLKDCFVGPISLSRDMDKVWDIFENAGFTVDRFVPTLQQYNPSTIGPRKTSSGNVVVQLSNHYPNITLQDFYKQFNVLNLHSGPPLLMPNILNIPEPPKTETSRSRMEREYQDAQEKGYRALTDFLRVQEHRDYVESVRPFLSPQELKDLLK